MTFDNDHIDYDGDGDGDGDGDKVQHAMVDENFSDSVFRNSYFIDNIRVTPSHHQEEHSISMRPSATTGNFTSDEIEELKQLLSDHRSLRLSSSERITSDHHHLTQQLRNHARRTIMTTTTTNASASESSRLSKDTFSFLIAARSGSLPFGIGMLVVLTKLTMYSLVLADMIANGSPGNPLGIAVSLEWAVAVSQTIAVAGKPILYYVFLFTMDQEHFLTKIFLCKLLLYPKMT